MSLLQESSQKGAKAQKLQNKSTCLPLFAPFIPQSQANNE